MTTTYPSFPEFFEAVHGHAPYRWQETLAEYLVTEGRVPGRVAVPTGLGKTSTVDAVVWALGRQVHLGQERTIGQRIFLAVERRVIVEGTGSHIAELVDAINEAPDGGVLYPVLTALRSLSSGGGDPIASTFHGARRATESLRPTGVQIISTTASQITLRAAGRAPGTGPNHRAAEAGLTMVDSVVLFDEPHLAAPQVGALVSAMRSQRRFEVPGVPGPQISVLGATIPPGLDTDDGVVAFDPESESSHAVERFSVYRPLEVAACDPKDVVGALTEATTNHVSDDDGRRRRRRVLVVANTVATAEKVYAALAKRPPEGYAVRLVTGRFRATESPTAEGLGEESTITVSTQVVEAGVDFTCDLLVSELAPWPSLTQRLGRLNRDGSSRENALAVVVTPTDSKTWGTQGTRAVYGQRPVAAAGVGLSEAFAAANAGDREYDKRIQVSPNNHPRLVETMLAAVRSDAGIDLPDADESVFWPEQVVPATITPAVGSAFLETAAPVMDSDVWRTGISPVTPTLEPVTLAWRSAASGDTLAGALLGRMPMAGETVQVPVSLARDIVTRSRFVDNTDGADEVAPYRDHDDSEVAEGTAVVYRRGRWVPVKHRRDIFPGSSVVISAAFGGYSLTRGAVSGTADPVPDTSLRLALREGRWAPVTEASLNAAGVSDEAAVELLNALHPEDPAEVTRAARIRAATPLVKALWGEAEVRFVGKTPAVFIPALGGHAGQVTLSDHLRQVGDTAGDFARSAGLPEDVASAVERAGWLHDVGKAHPAYQRWFHAPEGTLVAKPVGNPSPVAVGLPKHWRHECASLAACDSENLLVKWLIASHHGRGRGPWFGQVDTASVGWMRRELEKTYGPWGVCYIEAVLKSADAEASARPLTDLEPVAPFVESAIQTVQEGDAETLGRPVVPSAGSARRLAGLADGSASAILATAGVLVAASSADPTATVRWDDTTPVLTTTDAGYAAVLDASSLWDGAVATALYAGDSPIIGGHHKAALSPMQVVELSEAPDAGTLARGLASAVFAPHLRRILKEDKKTGSSTEMVQAPSAVFHSNGNLLAVDAAFPASMDALTDPCAGWEGRTVATRRTPKVLPAESKDVGRVDVAPTGGPTEFRAGVTRFMLLGALACPQAAPGGLGVTPRSPRRRVLALPQVAMRAGELLSVLRAGDVGAGIQRECGFIESNQMKYTLPGDLVRA